MNSIRSLPVLITSLMTFLLITSSCQTDKVVNMESLLTDMINRHSVTQFPDPPYQLKQFSSYDRNSVSPEEDGWFANADYSRFVKEENIEGRREFVLFDHQGQGAIVRWWMTFAGEGSHEGTVRVYIDGETRPVIEDSILKVLSGHLLAEEPLSISVSPKTDYYRRGHNLYLPIPYNNGCKITYECDAVVNKSGRITPSIYYNINYREYDDVAIESFSPKKLTQYLPVIEDANNTLKENPVSGKIAYSESLSIDPGNTKVATIRSKGQALSGIKIRLTADNTPQALRSTVLSISFDGINSVWAPVGDFFGTGFIINESETWYSSVSADGTMSCNWITPFKKNVEVSLINFGDQIVNAEMELVQERYSWSSGSMYFGAVWHEYNRIRTAGSEHVGGTGEHFDINYIDIDG
ncbi:MAG: DUF2961 domain-containing protein, partial [Bacteroidales bacterium]|nr:DUF2961 domain-containing protein [Bacteroidales bacterium]